jgi:hypothetical protein
VAAAENHPIVAAAAEDQPAVDAPPSESSFAATAAGAENLVGSVQLAVEVQAATASAAEAGFYAVAADPAAVEAQASPFAM